LRFFDMLRLIVAALVAVSAATSARALNISVTTNEEEKLAYVHLWGPIEIGGDGKFRMNIFSRGGSVDAAMGIGDQIRILQALSPGRTERKYDKHGRWIRTKEDPVRINCYRSILEEIMRDGASNYLARYVEAQTDTPVVPAPTQAPVEPSEDVKTTEPATQQSKKSLWAHNRSIMYMTEDGTRRQIYYDDPRPGLKEVGVKQGTLLFDGVVDGTMLYGSAFVFAKECASLSFAVTGKLTRDGKRITLNGKAPRIGTHCRVAGNKQEELIFDFFK
jgi:hypothetical protein